MSVIVRKNGELLFKWAYTLELAKTVEEIRDRLPEGTTIEVILPKREFRVKPASSPNFPQYDRDREGRRQAPLNEHFYTIGADGRVYRGEVRDVTSLDRLLDTLRPRGSNGDYMLQPSREEMDEIGANPGSFLPDRVTIGKIKRVGHWKVTNGEMVKWIGINNPGSDNEVWVRLRQSEYNLCSETDRSFIDQYLTVGHSCRVVYVERTRSRQNENIEWVLNWATWCAHGLTGRELQIARKQSILKTKQVEL